MKVKVLNDKYIIGSDTRQYTVALDNGRVDKEGKPILDYIGFYRDIEYLLIALFKQASRKSDAETIEQFLEDVKKAQDDVTKIAQKIGKLVEKKKIDL